MNATDTQQTGLKALSVAILERNRQSNRDATDAKNNATLPLENGPQKLHELHNVDEPFPFCDRHPMGAYCSCKAGFGKCQNCDEREVESRDGRQSWSITAD